MKHIHRLTATLLCTLLGAAAPLSASADRVYTAENPLVYEDAWDLWPYTFLNENGQPDGYNIDLLKLMLKELNIPYMVKLKPTADALNDLRDGRSDLMLAMDAGFHEGYATFGKTVVQLFTHSVVYQKGQPVPVRTADDLGRQHVVVHTGSFSHHLMQDNGWGANAEPYDDMKEAIRKVSSDRQGQIVWNTMSLKWLMRKYQITNLEIAPIDMTHGEYKFLSADSSLLARLDSVYGVLRATDRLQPIQNKWFYPERHDTGIPSWVWTLAAALAVVGLLALAYYLVYRLREKQMTGLIQKRNKRLALILQTGNTRIWTYNISRKTFTWIDTDGRPTRTHSAEEFSHRYPPEDFSRLQEALAQLADLRQKSITLNLRAHELDDAESVDREYIIALSVLRSNREGTPTVIIGTKSDVTEAHRKQQKARQTRLRYQSIFNSAMIDMAYYDADGILTNLNQKACQTLHGEREELLARRIRLQDAIGLADFPIDGFDYFHSTQIIDLADPTSPFSQPGAQGTMYYEHQLVPVYDERHRLLCIYGTGRDATEVANTYHLQQQGIEQLRQATQKVTDYVNNIDYALKTGGVRMVNYSPQTHTLAVYSSINHVQHALTQTRAINFIDDTDKRRAMRLFTAMDNLTTTPIEADLLTTIRTKGDRRLHLKLNLIPTYDGEGRVKEYFGMFLDVSEVKATEQQLALETAKAQEVETVKNAFLRNMSYEIRTPLNTVVGFAELFEQPHSAEDEAVFISQIKENSAQLLKLINDILFLSRLDARMIDIKPQPIDFAEVFESHCETGWRENRQPGVSYVVENHFDHLVVNIDNQNLGIVIDQVIANATEHTASGSVRARYDYINNKLIVTVDDTGCGISKEQMAHIFERFATGPHSGTGLGLPICQELTAQMGGTLNINSEEGKGTTVWISIPCQATDIQRK